MVFSFHLVFHFREPPANIMYDRRVVRGNTYAAQVLPPVSFPFTLLLCSALTQ